MPERRPAATRPIRALLSVTGLAYRRDPWRTILALVPVFPLLAGIVAISGRDILSVQPGHSTHVIVPATAGGVAVMAAAVVGYWQAANGLLRLLQVTSSELDFALLARLSDVHTIDMYDDPAFADRLELLRVGRGPLVNALALLGGLVGLVAGTLVTAGLFAAVNPWLAALPLLALPVVVVYARTEASSGEAEERVAENRRIALHLYDVGTGPSEGKELRALGHTDALLRRYTATWNAVDAELTKADTHALKLRLASWAGYCAVVAAVLAIVLTTADRRLSGPSLFLLAMAATQLTVLASNGAATVAGLRNSLQLAGHHARIVDATSLHSGDVHVRREFLATPSALERGISLHGVRFRYPDAAADALGPIDLELPAGSVTAVVGPNGAGKTTLVNLLLGLRRPTGGSILIDGQPLAAMDPAAWYAQTSVVCQDFTRFELTARESVACGDLSRLMDDQATVQALIRGEAEAIVSSLPDGLDTVLGQRFGGRELSSGQWQRIALARGFMRPRPLLLILDEPTVSIDAVTEQRLLDRCVGNARTLAQTSGSTVVFVSHRYATTRLADQILMIEGGEIVEHGSHADLLAADSRYAEIYRSQQAAYG
jgi:ATP-binding cassette, subfamily B, bacterial